MGSGIKIFICNVSVTITNYYNINKQRPNFIVHWSEFMAFWYKVNKTLLIY